MAAILPTLRSVSDPVRRDGYLQLLSRRSGVDERVLLESLRQPQGVGPGRPSFAGAGGSGGGGPDGAHAGGRINLDAILASPAPSTRRRSNARSSPSSRPCCGSSSSTPRASCVSAIGCRSRPWSRPRPASCGGPSWPTATPTPTATSSAIASSSSLDPTLEALARTLYARADPEPETDEALDQSVEQCLHEPRAPAADRALRLQARGARRGRGRHRHHHPRPRPARDPRPQRERAELDRRLDTETLLSKTSRRTAASTP